MPHTSGKTTRKVTSGPVRDKARTMKKMIAAVGKVIQKKGYPGLTAPNIAKAAQIDKKLVWTYFGGVDQLIEAYISQKDFWNFSAQKEIESFLQTNNTLSKEEINTLLLNQFETLLKDKALQKIIHWEIGESNDTLRRLADQREEIGEELFSRTKADFEHSTIDIRARLALLISGIYYLSLHAKSNGSMFCGIDINDPEGKARIESSITAMIFESYDQAQIK